MYGYAWRSDNNVRSIRVGLGAFVRQMVPNATDRRGGKMVQITYPC